MATLNRPRSRSFRLRNTCRLSLSERASGMWISRVKRPIGICGPPGGLRASMRWSGGGFGQNQLLHGEALEHVADLDIVEVRYAHAAFKAGANFVGVFFETAQRTDAARVDHHAFAHHPHFRIAFDKAIHDVAAGNGANAFDAQGVANFGAPEMSLFEDR